MRWQKAHPYLRNSAGMHTVKIYEDKGDLLCIMYLTEQIDSTLLSLAITGGDFNWI